MKTVMKTLNATVAAIALAASSMVAGDAFAVTADGTLGPDSTGTVDISITKTKQAQISGLSDITLGAWTLADGAVSVNSTVCVYSTTAGGSYTVTAQGDGAANAFTLSDGHAHTLVYTPVWNSGGVGNLADSGTTLVTTVASSTLTNAATDDNTCNGASPGPTAQLNIHITNAAMVAAPSGTYTGVITILITPV